MYARLIPPSDVASLSDSFTDIGNLRCINKMADVRVKI